MAQTRPNFDPAVGDDTSGALRKLDNNCADLDTRVTAAKTAADSASTAAGNAQTTATTANTTANTANATANAAMPKAGGTFTGNVGTSGTITTSRGALGQTAGASLEHLTLAATTANVDRMTTVLYRGVAGNAYTNCFWRQQRVVDSTGFGFLQIGDGSNGGTVSLNSITGTFTLSGANGNAVLSGTLTQNSDYRIKDAVVDIDPVGAAAALRANRPIEYHDVRQEIGSKRVAGFIAHELQANLPLLVDGEKDAVRIEYVLDDRTIDPEGDPPPLIAVEVPDLQTVNYIGLVPYLNAGWQWLDAEVAALRADLDATKASLAAVLERLAALEAR